MDSYGAQYYYLSRNAQVVRLMLHYVGEDYEEPQDATDDWFDDMFEKGLDLPNLPYYMDDKVKMSQSGAILKYLGKKHRLEAITESDVIRQDQAIFQGYDMQFTLGALAYNKDIDSMKDNYIKQYIPMLMKKLEHFKGDRKFMVGEKINFADFRIYESIAQHLILTPECLKDFPKLVDYVKRFENLPAIKAFMESKEFIKQPIFGPFAHWSNKDRDYYLNSTEKQ